MPQTVSLGDALGSGKVVSLQDALGGGKAPPPPKKSFTLPSLPDAVVEPFTRLRENVEAAAKGGMGMMKAGMGEIHSAGQAPGKELLAMHGALETALGAGQYAASGLMGFIQSVAGDPSDIAIGALGKATHAEPASIQAGKEFMDTVYQVALGGEGAAEHPGMEVGPKMPPEVRARQVEVKKQAVKVNAAFDDLAATNPTAVTNLADKSQDPMFAKYLKTKVQKFVDASEKELNANGVAAAKAGVDSLEPPKWEDIIKAGTVRPPLEKPSAVTPEVLGAGMRTTAAAVHEALTEPEIPLVAKKEFPHQVVPGSSKDFVNMMEGGGGTSKMRDQAVQSLHGFIQKNAGVSGAWSLDHMKAMWKGTLRHSPGYSYPFSVEFPWKTEHFKDELAARRYMKETQDAVDKNLTELAAERKAKGIPDDKSPGEMKDVSPRSEGGKKSPSPFIQMHRIWQQHLDALGGHSGRFFETLRSAALAGKALPTHQIMDIMIKTAPEGVIKDVLTKLREHVPNLPTMFHFDNIVDTKGGVEPSNVRGLYDGRSRTAHIQLDRYATLTQDLQTMVHEWLHAATNDFMYQFPDHPAVKGLKKLSELARERMHDFLSQTTDLGFPVHGQFSLARGKFSDDFYGFTNAAETLAEAGSNPTFQTLLVKSAKMKQLFERLTDVVHQGAKKIGEMLGIKSPDEIDLLSNILSRTDEIMAAQKKFIDEGGKFTHQTLARSEKSSDDPIMYFHNGIPVTRSSVEAAFRTAREIAEKVPGVAFLTGKIEGYMGEAIRTFNPGAQGDAAKTAEAVTAKAIAEQLQADSMYVHQAETRRTFWNQRKDLVDGFLKAYESGKGFADPILAKASGIYHEWNARIAAQDHAMGLQYEARDHYMAHIFEDPEAVLQFVISKHGKKWGDPGFIKDRAFDLYEEAVKAGFRPKYTNPEDIMLARQHASSVARMKIQVLRDLEKEGLAKRMAKGDRKPPEDWKAVDRRAPNGEWYWVNEQAHSLIHAAFDTPSLWNKPGFLGDMFRGAMFLKNTIVPVELSFSLFHALHVATIDNATGMVRASKLLLSGKMNPAQFMAEMVKSATYGDTLRETYNTIRGDQGGHRLLRIWQGKITDLTDADKQSMQYMFEGGFVPEMSSQYRTSAVQRFRDAIQKHSATAIWHAPFAALSLIQKPIFEHWIPSLKIASYLRDVDTALKTDPELVHNPSKRALAFNKIRKSVDNRYGEMAYGTLFWPKYVKDLAVANTLSLGWTLGFVREYGGGVMDLGHLLDDRGNLVRSAQEGNLDRPLFLTFYNAQALAYGGLLTWALSGNTPQTLEDYIYPQNGEKNPNGSPKRVTTMFYTREFMGIAKHIQNEGVREGLTDAVVNKSSGLIGMAAQWATGVNAYGKEIRDPNSPAYKQVEQTLVNSLKSLEPLSRQAIDKTAGTTEDKTLAYLGLSPAPQYATESPLVGQIKSAYDKYVAPKETPYDQAEKSQDLQKAKALYKRDDPGYDTVMDQLQDKYHLNGADMRRLRKSAKDDIPSAVKLFKRLDWETQKTILDRNWSSMSEDEKDLYLRNSNKSHLRGRYEPPVTK